MPFVTSVWVVIPAAGVGKRMQADRPKQYLPLAGKTVLEQTLACFSHSAMVQGMVVVVSEDDPYWAALAPTLKTLSCPLHVTWGGKERADSVRNGLRYLREQQLATDEGWVLVHDAARPCLATADLAALLQALSQQDVQAALLASPVRDTMKRADSQTGRVLRTESREHLWHALTPQAARLGVLYQALEQGLAHGWSITDEASALEQVGIAPLLVEGQASNIKITHPADLALATFFLEHRGRG